MVSARKITCYEPDPDVTMQSPVVWPRAGTRQTHGNELNLPLGNVDKFGCASSGRTACAG
jgi:hypothetical protein